MITLFENGQASAQIVLSAEAGPAERRAAREFQRIVKSMGGVALPVLEDAAAASDGPSSAGADGTHGSHPGLEDAAGRVCIGWAPAELDVDLSESAQGYDGYVIRCAGNVLALAGRRPCSALYAVYRLFEDHLGCGFFEEGEQIPQRDTVSIGDLNGPEIYHKPRFKWRMYFANMQDAYSGMRWWTWEEFRPWVDYLVKKRFNILESGNIADCCGIGALAANRLGVPVQLTDWQRERIALLRRVFDYAREAGIRIRYRMQLHVGTPAVNPGFSPYADGRQLQEFVDGYEAMTGEKIRVAPLEWCGESEIVLDPRDPVTRRFTTAVVESYAEALGTDHLYSLWLPTEETWVEDDPDRAAELTHASVDGMIQGHTGRRSGRGAVQSPGVHGQPHGGRPGAGGPGRRPARDRQHVPQPRRDGCTTSSGATTTGACRGPRACAASAAGRPIPTATSKRRSTTPGPWRIIPGLPTCRGSWCPRKPTTGT